MNPLSAIFSNEAVALGMIVKDKINSVYENIAKVCGGENLEKPAFGLYYHYPFLFTETFCEIDEKQAVDIAVAGVLYLDYILYIDAMLDGQVELRIQNLLEKTLISQEAIKILSKYFSEDSKFWTYMRKYTSQYIDAIREENHNHHGQVKEYSFDEAYRIAIGKAAVAKTTIAALASLTGQYEKITQYEETQDDFAFAFQMFDDLRDWKIDFKSQAFSKLLSNIMIENQLDRDTDIEIVAQLIYKGRYLGDALNEIGIYCELAMLKAHDSKTWIRYLRSFQTKVERLKSDMVEMGYEYSYKNSQERWIESDFLELNDDLKKGLSFLKNQFLRAYPELGHYMVFPHDKGFTAPTECVFGDVFQRSFILNLLVETYDNLNMNHESYFLDALEYVVEAKSEYYPYGWSYFPSLPELAPDIDTLAEIIKADRRLNNGENYEAFQQALNFVWKNGMCEDGLIETWIIDKNAPEAQKAETAATNLWGRAADPEVVSNLCLALYDDKSQRFKNEIVSAVEGLSKRQTAEGLWKSTWYTSEYYGSYIISKLFLKTGHGKKELLKTYEQILSTQKLDGSFGKSDSAVLDTAFAILTLFNSAKAINKNIPKELLSSAVAFLLSRQRENIWHGENFIQMNVGRVENKEQYLYYKSATLVTSVVLYTLSRVVSESKF